MKLMRARQQQNYRFTFLLILLQKGIFWLNPWMGIVLYVSKHSFQTPINHMKQINKNKRNLFAINSRQTFALLWSDESMYTRKSVYRLEIEDEPSAHKRRTLLLYNLKTNCCNIFQLTILMQPWDVSRWRGTGKKREKNYAAFNVCTMESVFLSNNYKSEGFFHRLNSSSQSQGASVWQRIFNIRTTFQICVFSCPENATIS